MNEMQDSIESTLYICRNALINRILPPHVTEQTVDGRKVLVEAHVTEGEWEEDKSQRLIDDATIEMKQFELLDPNLPPEERLQATLCIYESEFAHEHKKVWCEIPYKTVKNTVNPSGAQVHTIQPVGKHTYSMRCPITSGGSELQLGLGLIFKTLMQKNDFLHVLEEFNKHLEMLVQSHKMRRSSTEESKVTETPLDKNKKKRAHPV